ncbi:MAG: hypothetical protein GX090_09050 [Firmicutes bacterium]|nr:hypothetical protein [Bacillota bacterium]HOB34526.1 hypothetical protein [Bacillota bacterium]HPZ90562.1 hypothetical protein [Bacillota bacterium]HQE02385.1 hypothetical protein [Bacillota bacterium]
MDKILYVGPGSAGKTERLWQRYLRLAGQDNTNSILVLLWNARDVRDWRERVDLPWAGPLHVYTYFGWVQREIRAQWPKLRGLLGGNWLEPEFLTVETAQYAMLRHLRPYRDKFASVVTSWERLAIQLSSCLVLAALNGIPRNEIGRRLAAAMPGKDPGIFQAAQEVMDKYRAELERAGVLDYAFAVELYRRLLQDDEYRAGLQRFRHLLVDDADEQPPAALDLAEALLDSVETWAMAFASDGGHAGFFGADFPRSWQRFAGRGRVELVRPAGRRWLGLSGALYRSLRTGAAPAASWRGPRVEVLHCDLRSELLDKVGERVQRFVEAGVPPAEIAVIAPLADKVLEHTLMLRLNNIGVPLNVLIKNRRLIDEPYVRAMMTLALLAHPHWQLEWGIPDLAQSLQLLLKIDPVRAWLLGRQVRDGKLLPLEVWQRERVGFAAARGYDLLRQWLEEYRRGPEQPIDLFFQRVFGELLSRLPPARDDLVVCRQLIVSARKFLATARRLALEGPAGAEFINMLSAGTVAADSLLEPATREKAVILATPYAYLAGHHCTRVQVWLDCTSRRWFQQDVREIINPHVLKSDWREDEIWDDARNESLIRQNGARLARALLRRCTDTLVAAAANIDSQGFEQSGDLLEALLATVEGRAENAVPSRSERSS